MKPSSEIKSKNRQTNTENLKFPRKFKKEARNFRKSGFGLLCGPFGTFVWETVWRVGTARLEDFEGTLCVDKIDSVCTLARGEKNQERNLLWGLGTSRTTITVACMTKNKKKKKNGHTVLHATVLTVVGVGNGSEKNGFRTEQLRSLGKN